MPYTLDIIGKYPEHNPLSRNLNMTLFTSVGFSNRMCPVDIISTWN